MLLCFEVLEKSYNILVSCLLKNDDFVKNFTSLSIVAKVLFVDAFNGDNLTCQIMHGKIDLTKGTFTKNLTNAVEVNRCRWNCACVLKCHTDVPNNLFPHFLLLCQLRIMLYRAIGLDSNICIWWTFLIGEIRNKIILLNASFWCLKLVALRSF